MRCPLAPTSGFDLDIVIAVLVLAAAFAALAYPMYRTREQAVELNASTLDELLAERDGVYATLRDLELDRELGKLDTADYDALREKYMTRATRVLQELDALRGEGETREASAEIEKEVAALRRGAIGGREAGEQGRTTKDERPRTNDGRRTGSIASANGEVKAAELQCGNCGRPYNAGDQFCARCGQALE